VLRLTPNQFYWAGSAWYNTQQPVAGGFSTSFMFQLSGTTPGGAGNADGIAFLIQNSSLSALGPNGCGIGFGDSSSGCTPSTGGIPNSLAIEFNTYLNSGIDPSDSDVTIQNCSGTGPNSVDPTCSIAVKDLTLLTSPINMADGAVHSVTITYTPPPSGSGPGSLDVILDNTDLFPGGVVTFDITSIGLANGGTAFVGFTAATGGGDDDQDILNWTFTPQAQAATVTTNTETVLSFEGGYTPATEGYDANAQLTSGSPVTVQVNPIVVADQPTCNAIVQASFPGAQCFVYDNANGPNTYAPVFLEVTCPGSPTGGTCGANNAPNFSATLGTDFYFDDVNNPGFNSSIPLPLVGFLKGSGPDPLHPCTLYPGNTPPLFQSNQILSFALPAGDPPGNGKGVSGGTGSCWLLTYLTPGEAPSVTIVAPANNGTYQQSQTALANYTCTTVNNGSNSPTGPYLTQASCSATDTPGGSVAQGAQFDTTTLGPHTFTATVVDSATNTVSQTVTYNVQGTQTITFSQNAPASAAYNSSFIVAAGASSGLMVTLTSSGSCTNSGATFTMTSGTGTCSVIASQAGNTNYSAAPQVIQTVNATLASQTITFTTNAPSSAAYNSSFTVAAGASSGLTVTFSSSGACTNSSATFTMISGTGTCSVIASQAGNPNYYSAAPQVAQSVNATKASQTITFPPIPTQNGPGTVALTATATSGLTVTYSVISGPATVSGSTLTTTAAGSVTVQASQAGNANYAPATPVSQTFTITSNASGLNGKNCNGTYTGTYSGNLTVSSGQSCTFTNGGITGNLTQTGGTVVLENSSFVKGSLQMSGGGLSISNSGVSGNLEVTGGGTFSIGPTASIGGNLQIQNLPASAGTNQVCGASVQGNLEIQNSGTATLIGSPGCAGNVVGGNLQVQSNTATTAIYNNTIAGDLSAQSNTALTQIYSNTVKGNLSDQSNTALTQIYSNTVKGNLTDQNNTAGSQVFNNAVISTLQCSGDSSITGGGNTAKSKQGQCATF
jgi:hypothetical protein